MLKFIEYLNNGSNRIVALVVFRFYFDVILYIFPFACFHVKCLLHFPSLYIVMSQNYSFRIILLNFHSNVSPGILKLMEQDIYFNIK